MNSWNRQNQRSKVPQHTVRGRDAAALVLGTERRYRAQIAAGALPWGHRSAPPHICEAILQFEQLGPHHTAVVIQTADEKSDKE